MELEKTLNSQSSPEQKVQSWQYYMPLIQTILQSHRKQDSMILSGRCTEQQNEIESTDINLPIYVKIIFDKRQENVIEKRNILQQMALKRNWTTICKRIKLHHLVPYATVGLNGLNT